MTNAHEMGWARFKEKVSGVRAVVVFAGVCAIVLRVAALIGWVTAPTRLYVSPLWDASSAAAPDHSETGTVRSA